MSGIDRKHGKIIGKAVDIYRSIEETVAGMNIIAMLFCVLPLLKIMK
ncbi:MAG: hypothetical protein K2J80_03305 [Oscillospiraceae bacterium]|nr:hypothetical protein [Oscillospiraceae bacterium]